METPFLDDENDRKLVIYDTCPSGSVIISPFDSALEIVLMSNVLLILNKRFMAFVFENQAKLYC